MQSVRSFSISSRAPIMFVYSFVNIRQLFRSPACDIRLKVASVHPNYGIFSPREQLFRCSDGGQLRERKRRKVGQRGRGSSRSDLLPDVRIAVFFARWVLDIFSGVTDYC